MDEIEKDRFRTLLKEKFNNELKLVNDTLEKYLEIIKRKQESNKAAYKKQKDDDDFKQKKKTYDKQYYENHKHELLNIRKTKYHTDDDYKEKQKQKQKNIYEKSKDVIKP